MQNTSLSRVSSKIPLLGGSILTKYRVLCIFFNLNFNFFLVELDFEDIEFYVKLDKMSSKHWHFVRYFEKRCVLLAFSHFLPCFLLEHKKSLARLPYAAHLKKPITAMMLVVDFVVPISRCIIILTDLYCPCESLYISNVPIYV